MRKVAFAVLLAGGVALAGCADSGMGTKQTAGAVLGGVGGAVAGAQFGRGTGQLAATAAGTLLGAWIGSEVGRSLDRADQQAATQTTQTALETYPSGQAATWSNPDRGTSGSATPTRTYQTVEGQYCREFQTEINVGGQRETGYGTACRQEDGTWKIMS